MTDLHLILLAVGAVLMFGFLYIVKLRRAYYREFIAGVPMRFYTEENRHHFYSSKCEYKETE